jgi:hypothetical protein
VPEDLTTADLQIKGLDQTELCEGQDWRGHWSTFQHFHARKDLLIRLFGSFAVSALVFFSFIPDILAQKDFFLAASASVLGLGAGGFRFMPCAFADARPFAFSPPLGSLPSARVQAGVFAISAPRPERSAR